MIVKFSKSTFLILCLRSFNCLFLIDFWRTTCQDWTLLLPFVFFLNILSILPFLVSAFSKLTALSTWTWYFLNKRNYTISKQKQQKKKNFSEVNSNLYHGKFRLKLWKCTPKLAEMHKLEFKIPFTKINFKITLIDFWTISASAFCVKHRLGLSSRITYFQNVWRNMPGLNTVTSVSIFFL